MRAPIALLLLVGLAPACAARPRSVEALLDPRERHLKAARQLTFGGENAEAYWSDDGKSLVFQAHQGEGACDQIYTMRASGKDVQRVSPGGRNTCAYFYPGGDRVLYASTVGAGPGCPAEPDFSQGYVWGLFDYDLYVADRDGGRVVRLTDSPGYDAEATISPDGSRIVFTSVRDGDLELYTMALDGSDVRRLTHTPGYDGGAFFSPDGKKIVYRAHHPRDAELASFQRLLTEQKVRPTRLEIWVMNTDGGNARQVTDNGAANFAPYFHPDGKRILFASNLHDPNGRNFDLYLIGLDGSGLERVTWDAEFDSFPMFSPDGKRLVWASNRHGAQPGDTNLFVADWVD
jgi:Tol biopolymer transport system component